jgi:hypothetical protein
MALQYASWIGAVVAGLVYANAAEWLLHRHLLHGLGKKKSSFWHFHWGEHHRNSRKRGFADPDYARSVFGWHAQGKEALGLAILVSLHLPLAFWAPFFVLAVVYSAFEYMRCHKRSHRDPQWAKQHLPWHYDHHMGSDQDANWCVTWPWFDWIMGTRIHHSRSDSTPTAMRAPSVPPPA